VAFGPPRATFTVSGRVLRVFSLRCRRTDLTPAALLSAGCLSPRSRSALQPHPHAQCECTSRGVPCPFSARQTRVSVCPGGHHDLPHRPSSGFLTPSTVCSTRLHARLSGIDSLAKAHPSPQRSWGFPALSARPALSNRPGRVSPGFPLYGLLLSRDGHDPSCPPSRRFAAKNRAAPFRETTRLLDRLRFEVSIAGESVYRAVANHSHQPS